ncbi:MAG: EF-P lysine aminoacylase EpmA [Steroidobacteraceae bacterium]
MTDWRPSATRETLRHRARLLAIARDYFAATGALEVETPSLSQACVTDIHLASVAARVCGGRYFLQTSPEYAMKRLLAAGFGDIWQAARVYRDGESGRYHCPEFTLFEWYRLGLDHHALMHDVETLTLEMLAPTRTLLASEKLSYCEALDRHAGIDALSATSTGILRKVREAGLDAPAGLETDRDACLDLLMSTVIGPHLGKDRLTFIYDYPASQAALARVRGPVASRFEMYLDGLELANGFHELTHAPEQRERFEQDMRARASRGLPTSSMDENFLAALAHGLPECAGVALGFDRLLMCALRLSHIDEALAFRFESG